MPPITAVEDGRWLTPARFNFTRDVVEELAADLGREALMFVDAMGVIERRSFQDVAGHAARWAGLLRASGVQPGDRVLVLVGKRPEWHEILLGALKIGAVTIPCADMLRARDLTFRARHSGAVLLVAQRSAEDEVAQMEEPPPVLYLDDAEPLLHAQPPFAVTHDTAATDNAFILYTSGTTKDPKGVVHTHAYCFAKAMQAEHWLGARAGDRVWCTAGTGWAKSIWNGFLGPWSRGAEIVVHEGAFDPHERFELIRQLGVDVLCQAPTEYRLMAKLDDLDTYDLSGVRHAVSAGEPLNPEVIKTFRDAFGLTIHDGYGQTENTLLVANCLGAEVRPGSMGLPTPGHEVAVIDAEGNEVAAGEEGDVAVRGRPPSLFAGYWDAPEETAAVLRGDWYVTGDRATRDEDGYFWFTGRADDVILTAAYRVGPFEVESALLEHPAVAESAVVGKPDVDRGQIVKAFVVLRPGFEPGPDLVLDLKEHAKRVTAPYKYPREIEFVEELPKTRSGKIRRVELRRLELERAGPDVRASTAALPEEDEDEPEAVPAVVLPPMRDEQAEQRGEKERRKVDERLRREEEKRREVEERRRRKDAEKAAAELRKEEERERREETKHLEEERKRLAKEQARADDDRRKVEAERAKAAERARREQERRAKDQRKRAEEEAKRQKAASRRGVEEAEREQNVRAEEERTPQEEPEHPAAAPAEPEPPAEPEQEPELEPERRSSIVSRLTAYGISRSGERQPEDADGEDESE